VLKKNESQEVYMPPQVIRPEGSKPVTTNSTEGVQEVKSTEVQKKSSEQTIDTPKNDAAPRRATAKEKASRQAELNATGASQQAKVNSQFKVKGTSGDDNIHVSKAKGLPGKLGMYEVDVNGQKRFMTKEQLEHSTIRAGAGNDTVVIDSNVKARITVDGGSGDDVIIGGKGSDKLSGGSGNDIIAGRGGKDEISGGAGKDVLLGGQQSDRIDGGSGKDYISGGSGGDLLQYERGKDTVIGGPGFDLKIDTRKKRLD
jgi:Ca2+-binding RTX toxin-like protein